MASAAVGRSCHDSPPRVSPNPPAQGRAVCAAPTHAAHVQEVGDAGVPRDFDERTALLEDVMTGEASDAVKQSIARWNATRDKPTPAEENVFRIWWSNAIGSAALICRKEAQRYADLANGTSEPRDKLIYQHRANQSKELEDAMWELAKSRPYHTTKDAQP
jgi:hypothetical protein